jgi:ABC-type branched-subunit amino acid transport system substrate-binding protein
MGVMINRKIIIFFIFIFSLQFSLSQIKVGVALPLFETSEDKSQGELGKDILNGIKFAIEKYNKGKKSKVQAVIKDTWRDADATKQIFEDFSADKKIICAVGPVYSTLFSNIGNIADNNSLSVISPTATGDSLAESFKYLFQLNPSYRVRGQLMADYLISNQSKTNIAIISESTYGRNFANHFSSYAKKYGGNIVFNAYYDRKSVNIKPIIDSLLQVIKDNDLFINVSNLNLAQQQKLEMAGVRWSLIDSLIKLKLDASIYYLFGKNGWRVADSLKLKPYKLKDLSKKFIQGFIDAVYIPISNSSEISMIVPALFSDGLSGFLAGTGDWNNPDVLEENKAYIKNLLFESEYYPEGSEEFAELQKNLKKTKYRLNKNFLFGYDAMMIVLALIDEGYTTRETFYDGINKVNGFKAVKSNITINDKHINSELNILTYSDGLQLIDRYRLQDK